MAKESQGRSTSAIWSRSFDINEEEIMQDNFITSNKTVEEASAMMAELDRKILVVTDYAGDVTGIISEGDMRRLILKNVNPKWPISSVCNHSFFSLSPNILHSPAEIQKIGREYGIRYIPVMSGKKLINIIDALSPHGTLFPIPVIIMAGGLGSRMGELTATTPKPMLPLAGVPMLERTVNELRHQGYLDITISVNYLSEVIKKHFGNSVKYLEETEPSGTCGCLRNLSPVVTPVIVMNGDVITKIKYDKLIQSHFDTGAEITAVVKTIQNIIPFGVVELDYQERFISVVEKPIHHHLTLSGIYVLSVPALGFISDKCQDMPNLINLCNKLDMKVNLFGLYENWMDVGTPADLARVQEEYIP
jgi:dTDP-glucose pyrophosphorylase